MHTMVCMVWYDIFFNLKPPYHKEASWTQYAQGTIDFVWNYIVCLVAEAVQWKTVHCTGKASMSNIIKINFLIISQVK